MTSQVIMGDCLDQLKLIPDRSIQFVCIDPPYGMISSSWDTIVPMEKLWPEFNRIITANGTLAIFGNEPFSSYVRTSNIKKYKYDWYWDKGRPSGFQCAKYKPMSRCENIMIFQGKETNLYLPVMEPRDKPIRGKIYGEVSESSRMTSPRDDKVRTYTHKYPQSIIKITKNSNAIHPTQKPVALIEYLIKNYTRPDDFVLDCFAGSGTTGVAAINTGRNYILIEKEQKYYDMCIERTNKSPL